MKTKIHTHLSEPNRAANRRPTSMKKTLLTLQSTVFSALAIGLLLIAASPAKAATFLVNDVNDVQDATAGDGICETALGNGVCTLRAAITEANALAGADIITLPAGTYTTTLTGGENLNASGDYDINTDITINGAGAGTTIVQAAATRGVAIERVFHIRFVAPGTTAVINDLTVRYGRYTTSTFGAGIRVDVGAANVTLNRVLITENDNGTSGGGIAVSSATNSITTLNNCTVSNNTSGGPAAASSIGAGIMGNSAATINLNNSTVTGNTGSNTSTTVSVSGGGITSIGTLNITDSMITNNTVTSSGSNTFSGGIHVTAGTTTITGSTISGNASTVTAGTGSGFAGGLYNQQATVSITDSTVSDNTASQFHGGIRTLASTTAAATTNITNSIVSGNTSVGEGGGVINIAGSTFASTTNITRSTISGNMATSATSVGGGVENFTVSSGLGTVNLINSTVSGNSSNNGAGIYNSGTAAAINSNYSTIASNTATTNGGGIFQDANGATNLKNSIVGDNTAGMAGPDIFGTITSQNWNHIEDTSGGTFMTMSDDVMGSDAQLGGLGNNGGTTPTHLPGAGSPVVNTIPSGTSDCGTVITTSQNAVSRPQQKACEKGSAERLGAAPLTAGSAVSRITHGAAGTFDIPLPLTGSPGIECRTIGGNYTVVITFNNNVVSGSASVTGTGMVFGAPTFSMNTMTINLTGVTDVQQISVNAMDVTDEFMQTLPSTMVPMKVLVGDTNGSSSVSGTDVGQTKSSTSPGTVDAGNFRTDVNANGAINSTDVGLVKTRSGNTL